jgi:hypothetical protein
MSELSDGVHAGYTAAPISALDAAVSDGRPPEEHARS